MKMKMNTTATNRKLRVLLTSIRSKTLIPNPVFQRRLVWNNRDKRSFLDTVLQGYPFPEIYIAAGSVDPTTGEGSEMLVDGQQRITTLYQYFTGAPELKLGREITPYVKLSDEQKIEFLEYEVVVRDLGKMSIDDIKLVFRRINATSYSLNAMEVNNARFEGELKTFAEQTAQHQFFESHHVFSVNEGRRMRDVGFALTFIITILSTYFNRDDELVGFLEAYNDEFPQEHELRGQIDQVFGFINACDFAPSSRVWKQSDLLTLLVEVYRALVHDGAQLNPTKASQLLRAFYSHVDSFNLGQDSLSSEARKEIADYARAAQQATNDRGSRLRRGEIVRAILLQAVN